MSNTPKKILQYNISVRHSSDLNLREIANHLMYVYRFKSIGALASHLLLEAEKKHPLRPPEANKNIIDVLGVYFEKTKNIEDGFMKIIEIKDLLNEKIGRDVSTDNLAFFLETKNVRSDLEGKEIGYFLKLF